MTTCEKHGCPLTPLFTSTFCARCDEEAAVNAGVSELAKRIYADGVSFPAVGPAPTPSANIDWYHNYPTCGTDANGSDVDDMDVCMGLKADMAPSNFALMAEMQERSREEPDVVSVDIKPMSAAEIMKLLVDSGVL
jgi:hypothetical protein